MKKSAIALVILLVVGLGVPSAVFSQDSTLIAEFDGEIDAPYFLLNVDSSAFSLTERPGWLKVTTGLNVDGQGRPRKGPNAIRLMLDEQTAVPLNFEAEFKIEAEFTEPGQVVNLKFGPYAGADLVLLYGMLGDTAVVPTIQYGAGGLFREVAVPDIGPVVKFRIVRQGAPYDYENQEGGDVGPWVTGQRIGYINRAKFQYADGDDGEWVTLGEQMEWISQYAYYANTFAAANFLAHGAPDPFTPIDVYWDYIRIKPLEAEESFDTWYAAEFNGLFGEPYFLRQEDSTKVSLEARPGWLRVTTDYNADGSGRPRKGPNAGRLSLRPAFGLVPIDLPIKVESQIEMTPTEPGQMYMLVYEDQQIRYGLIGEGATVPTVMAGDNGNPDVGRAQNMRSVEVPDIGSVVRLRIMQSGSIAIYQYADGEAGDWVTVHQVGGLPEGAVMFSNFAAANYMAYGAPYPATPIDVDIDYVRHTVAEDVEFEEFSQYLMAEFDGEIDAPYFLLNVDSSAFSLTERPGWLKVTTGLNVDGQGRPRKGPNAIRLMVDAQRAAPLNFEAEFKIEAEFTEVGQVVNLKLGPTSGQDLILLWGIFDGGTVPMIRVGAGQQWKDVEVPDLGPVARFRIVRQGAPYDYENQEGGDVGPWVMGQRIGYINRAKFQYADGDNGEWVTLGEQMEWISDHAYYANTFAAANFLANGAPDPFTPFDVYWDYIRIKPLEAEESFDTWYAAEFNGIFAEPYFLRQEDTSRVSLEARPGWLRVTTDYNADGSGRPRKGPNAGRLSLRPAFGLVPIELPIKVESQIEMTPTEAGQVYILSYEDQQIRYGLIGEGATVPTVMAGDNGDPGFGRAQNMRSVEVPDIGSVVRLRILQSGPIAIYQYADGESGDWVTVHQVGGLPEAAVLFANFAAANYMAYGAPYPATPIDVDIDYVRHTVAEDVEFEEFSQYLIAEFDGEVEAPFYLSMVDSSAFSLTERPGWLKVTTGLNADGSGRPRKGPNAIRLMLAPQRAIPLNFEAEFKIEAEFTEPGQVVNLTFAPYARADLVLLYGMLGDTALVPTIKYGAGGLFREVAVPDIGPVVKFRIVRQGAPYDYVNQEGGDVGPWVMGQRIGYINRVKFQYADGDDGEWVTLGEQMEWIGDHAYYANTFAAANFLANGAPDPFTPVDVYWDYIRIKPLEVEEPFDTYYAAEFTEVVAEPFFFRQEDSTKLDLESRPGWMRITTGLNVNGGGVPRKGPNAGRLAVYPQINLPMMPLPLKGEAKIEMTPVEPGQVFVLKMGRIQLRYGLIGADATVPSFMAGHELMPETFRSVEVPDIDSVVRLRVMQNGSFGIMQYAAGDTGKWVTVHQVDELPEDDVETATFAASNFLAYGAPEAYTPFDADIDYMRFGAASEEEFQEVSKYLMAEFDGEIDAPYFLLNVDSSAFNLTERPGWLKVTTGLNVDGNGRPRKGPNAIRLMVDAQRAAPLNFEAEFKIEAEFTEPGQVVNLKFGPFGGPGQTDLVLLYGMLGDTAIVPTIQYGAGGLFREVAVPDIGPVVKFRIVRQGAPYDYENQEGGDVGPWVMGPRLGYINRAKFQYADGDEGEWVTLGEQMEWISDHAYYANTFAAASFLANGAPDPFTPIDVYWDYIRIKPLEAEESFDTWYAAEFAGIFAEPYFLRQEDSTKVSLEARPGWLRVTTDYNADGSGRPRKGPNAGRLSLRPAFGLVPMTLPLIAEAKIEMVPSEPGQMFMLSYEDLQIRFGLIGENASVLTVMAGDNGNPDVGRVQSMRSVEVPDIGSVVRLRIMQQDSMGIFQYAEGDNDSWINVHKVLGVPAISVMFANFAAANYMAYGAPYPSTPLDVDIDYIRFSVAETEDIETLVSLNQAIPKQFALEQNYPNPFNPETTIKYQLPKRVNVKLEVFNILGQRVRVLMDKKQNAGRYVIHWDGTNDQGVPVSTGLYIYCMRAADFREVKRMVFLK